jgi:hypothetical protein
LEVTGAAMTIKYEISSEAGVTVITMLQEVTPDALISALHDVVAEYSYERRLWDFTKVEFNLSTEEMRKVSDVSKRLIDSYNKVAFAVGDPLAFGKIRQFMVYREGDNTVPGVFNTRADALAWLQEESTSQEEE